MQEIFLVHDQQESAAARKSFLEMSGYRVVLFDRGSDCIAELSKGLPGLVLMDILIEGPTGFDVTREIRERFTAQQLPVILTSTIYRSRVYREEAYACGAQAYILRPVKLEDLVQQVGEVLSHQVAPAAPVPEAA
ncbi:MAG: response regulator [Planctomycetota bacterium]